MPARKKTTSQTKPPAERQKLKAVPQVPPDPPLPGTSDAFSAAFNRIYQRDGEILEALRKA